VYARNFSLSVVIKIDIEDGELMRRRTVLAKAQEIVDRVAKRLSYEIETQSSEKER
jgi:hypothetical protein